MLKDLFATVGLSSRFQTECQNISFWNMCWLWCFILRGPDGNFMLYNTWKHSPGIHIRHQSKYPSDVDAKKFKQVPTFDIPFCETTIKSELYVIRHDQQLSWVFNDTVERHFHSRHNFQSISRLICLQTAKRVARIINTSRSCFFLPVYFLIVPLSSQRSLQAMSHW